MSNIFIFALLFIFYYIVSVRMFSVTFINTGNHKQCNVIAILCLRIYFYIVTDPHSHRHDGYMPY
jgi:hypothetical protein